MEQKLGDLFKNIHNKFAQHINCQLKDQDLTMSQLNILIYLFEKQGKKVTQKEIGEAFGLKHSTVIGILKRMESKKLLRCIVDSQNKRYRNVFLEEKAYKVKEVMLAHREMVDVCICKNLTKDEVDQLRYLLKKVQDNFLEI